MKLTRIPDTELPSEVRAMLDEMVEANRDDIARFRAAFTAPATATAAAHDATVRTTSPHQG
jgi:hypothetical protein